MASHLPPNSFSSGRRWGIFFSVMLSIAAVASLVVMLNYLGARHFLRFTWSAKTSPKLSLPTLNLLGSITNDVKIVVYYDKTDGLYDDIADLLKQYHLANPRISVQTVDYNVDNTAAVQIKNLYNLGSSEDKNLIIYECNGQLQITSGDQLANYSIEQAADDSPTDANGQRVRNYQRHTQEFDGEPRIDADLIRVTGPPMKACYLTGDGEPPLENQGQGRFDYSGFAAALSENHIGTISLSLAGTNAIPTDCNLLIIACPRYTLGPDELQKVSQYLDDGGRMMVLFNNNEAQPVNTGLESILAEWGVEVGQNVVKDPDNTASGGLLAVMNFATNHPCVGSLVGSELWLYPPRSISPRPVATPQGQEAPTVMPLAWAGPRAYVTSGASQYQAPNAPVIVAVEKKDVKGVLQRGTTRIIVTGDAVFLGSGLIKAEANRDFAELAARWLLDQSQSMGGVPPRRVMEYRVTLTHAQMTSIRWIFLGAMPGGILLFGGLVWLRRRH
jgi:ABC-type uncharacterized transport system